MTARDTCEVPDTRLQPSAQDVAAAQFPPARNGYDRSAVRTFLAELSDVIAALDLRLTEVGDELAIAESTQLETVKIRRELADCRAETALLSDRVLLAETVREDALSRLRHGPACGSEQK